MGNLFPDSDEYPDYLPMPRITARLFSPDGPIVSLAIAGTMLGLCPVILEDHAHPIHEDHRPVNVRLLDIGVSSTSSTSVTPSLRFQGYAPTLTLGSTSS